MEVRTKVFRQGSAIGQYLVRKSFQIESIQIAFFNEST